MASEPWIDPPTRSRNRSIDDFQQAGELDDTTIGHIYTAIADGPSRLQQAVQLYLHQYHPQTQHHTRATRDVKQQEDTADSDDEDEEKQTIQQLQSTSLTDTHHRPHQNPTFLLYPLLPASPFHESSSLAWTSTLTSNYSSILSEFVNLYRTQSHTFTKVEYNCSAGQWHIYPIVNQGLIDSVAAEHCPATAALIRAASKFITTDCSLGYAYFSVIAPGTKITPHTGVCNMKLRGHLGLIVPSAEQYDCSITVANETRSWKENECLLFDDSYTHSVSHTPKSGVTPSTLSDIPSDVPSAVSAYRSAGIRAVLLFDYWHPALSSKEIQVVRTFLRAS